MTAIGNLPGPPPRSASGLLHFRLFGHLERVIDLDAEVSNGAFDLRMVEEQLYSAQILRAAIDHEAFVRRSVWVPYAAGLRPIFLTHQWTIRAYCRVDRCKDARRRLANR